MNWKIYNEDALADKQTSPLGLAAILETNLSANEVIQEKNKEEENPQNTANQQNTTNQQDPTTTQADIPEETIEETQEDEPYIDNAMREYLKRQKTREAEKKTQELEDEEDEKSQEAEERAEKEHQAMLDNWYEGDRQDNIRHNKELEKDKARRDAIEQRENDIFHNDIAEDQKNRKEKQAIIKRAHDTVDKFGDSYEQQRLSHKKIEELSKNADIEKTNKINSAIRKQFFDSSQMRKEAKAEYEAAKLKEIDKKGKYVKAIKDTSLTINKIIAKADPTGTGDKIVSVMEHAYAGVEGYEKGGGSGAIVKILDLHSNGVATETVDTAQEYRDLHTKGVKLNKDEKFYNKDGERVTKVKSGDKTYATTKGDEGEEKEFSMVDRISKKTLKKVDEIYNPQTKVDNTIKNIKEGVAEGDFNKVANGAMDAADIKDDLGMQNK